MKRIVIDIETRSDIDIGDAGSYRYAMSPEFRILLFGFKIDDAPRVVVDLASGEKIPNLIIEALESGYDWENPQERVTFVAHNAQFEHWCLQVSGIRNQIEVWEDTMIHALYCGYPPSLAALGKALNLAQEDRKLASGTALISYFCKPMKDADQKKYGRKFHEPQDDPAKWELFKTYCGQDVETEAVVDAVLAPWPVPAREWFLWRLDVAMNRLGVRIDTDMLTGALSIIDSSTEDLTERAKQLTGLDNPNSPAQLRAWLNDNGVNADGLTKETVATLIEELKGKEEYQDAVAVLKIRQELGKSSLAKYGKIRDAICPDGRVRGISQFYGASRTGRYSGRLVQMQNLPRNHMDGLDEARELVKLGDFEMIRMCYGNVPDTLSQLIRTVFIASEGCKFVVSDFSAIEARVLAWMAGEEWVNEVFRTTGKIYEATAAQMFHVDVEKIKKGNPEYELRQKGKVATLALGYQGGPAAMIAMGALKQGITEDELPDLVQKWRAANPHICEFWYKVEKAAVDAVLTCSPQYVEIPGSLIVFRHEGDLNGRRFLTVQLPTGRKLHYAEPSIRENRFGKPALHFLGLGSEEMRGAGWGTNSTYAGSLSENITQSIARDCLAEILLRLHARGLPFVFHVHDEVIVDCPADACTAEELCQLMAEPIDWAPGLILKGAGFESQYYMKD